MRARRVSVIAVAALVAAAARSGELTELPPAAGPGLERGVALLRCEDPESSAFWLSRATVLDAGAAANADVLLTVAHGLPSSAAEVERDCRATAQGRDYAIAAVWGVGREVSVPEHDWAVVLLTSRIRGDVRRWRASAAAESWLEQLVDGNVAVRVVLRYAGEAQTDCRLEGWTQQRLLVHTCRTYPGESGSPLVVGVDHSLVLIGVHIGSQLDWDGAKFNMMSVARPLDAAVMAAVEAATAHAAQERRRR